MKRFISLALLLALICTSCGSAGSTDDTTSGADTPADETGTTAPETEPDRLTELGEKDFGGRTFTILDANDHPDMHVNIPEDEQNGDILNDALFERNSFVADRYNLKFDYVTGMNGAEGMKSLKQNVLAGDDTYTLAIAPLLGGAIGSVALDGVLYDLASNEYLSLDQNWWSRLLYDSLRLDGKMYYTTGDISPSIYQMPACLFLNTRLAEDYGIDTNELCELVREGKWTLDEMIKVNKDKYVDTNANNKMDTEDTYGFVHHNPAQLQTDCFFTTAGVNLSTIDGSKLSVDIVNERTLGVIEKLRELIVDIKYTDDNGLIDTTFKEGHALMLYHYVESASQRFRDMKDDFLILPMPKYDEAQDDYHSFVNTWVDAFVAIPTTADPEFAGFVTEALAYWSYQNIREKAYDVTYKTKTSRDDNSADMLDIIFDTLYIDFSCIYDFGGLSTALTKVLKGKAELAGAIAPIESKIDGEIEKFETNWINGVS